MSWMQTYTGIPFDLNDITPHRIHPRDIVIALSRQPRFGGHTKTTYSVAQHSILVSEMVADHGGTNEQILAALLHDAHEAYIGDIPSPIKWFLGERYDGFKELQDSVDRAVAEAFNFDVIAFHDPLVKHADASALFHEKHALMPDVEHDGYEWDWNTMLNGREPFPIPVFDDGDGIVMDLKNPWADWVCVNEFELYVDQASRRLNVEKANQEVGDLKVYS